MGTSEPLVKEAGATGIDDIKGTGFVKDTHSLVNIEGYVDDLESRLTALRAGYLDNINNGNLATIPDISTLTAARIAHLDADISSRAAQSDIISDSTPFAGADIATIKAYVDDLESRLTALRAGYLDNINNADLLNIPDLSTLSAARIGYLDNINNGNLATIPDISTLSAAKIAYLDAAISSRATQSDIISDSTPFAGADIATIKAYVDEVESLLKNATYGLSALKTEIDANETKIDTIDGIVDELKADAVYSMTFWSDLQLTATIPAVAADVNLPQALVISEIPSGATIFRVIAMLKFRTVEDTSGSANALSGDQYVQVDDSSGTGYRNAIKLIDNLWTIDGNATEGGDVIVGNIDIADRVDGNDTYKFKIASATADGASLVLNEVQIGLKVFFRV